MGSRKMCSSSLRATDNVRWRNPGAMLVLLLNTVPPRQADEHIFQVRRGGANHGPIRAETVGGQSGVGQGANGLAEYRGLADARRTAQPFQQPRWVGPLDFQPLRSRRRHFWKGFELLGRTNG